MVVRFGTRNTYVETPILLSALMGSCPLTSLLKQIEHSKSQVVEGPCECDDP
jgi:hypothetical protein